MKLENEQIDYVVGILTERLQEDAGKYVAQEMLKMASEDGDVMATLFGGLMKDTSLDSHVLAINKAIGHLTALKSKDTK